MQFNVQLLAQTSISGEIVEANKHKPYLFLSYLENYNSIFSGYDGLVIDSSEIQENGRFVFRENFYKRGLYRINIQMLGATGMAGMILGRADENYIHFYLNGSEKAVNIIADASALTRSYQITANLESSNIQLVRDLRKEFFSVVDTVWTKMQLAKSFDEAHRKNEQESAMQEIITASKKMQKTLRGIIDTTSDVYTGLIATKYYNLGDNYGQYVPYFDSLVHIWQKIEPQNPYLLGLVEEINEFKNFIPIGSKAPEIILPSISGDSISWKGINAKLILIDFWASWCGPCRIENKSAVAPLYKKYHNKGFEVYGVSFDSNRSKWTQAIKKDVYPWIHVIETNGSFDSAVGILYKIKGIPTTYLLDKNGMVLAKNLRGSQLEEFVKGFFEE